jgi:hypothetical protein
MTNFQNGQLLFALVNQNPAASWISDRNACSEGSGYFGYIGQAKFADERFW